MPPLIARLQQIGVHDAGRPRHRPGQAQFDRLRRLPVAVRAGPSRPRLLPRRRRCEARRHPQEVRRAHREDAGEAGSKTAKQDAADILALETAIARRSTGPRSRIRDPVKTYHKIAIKDLPAYAPGFDWNAYLTATGVSAKVTDVVLYQASYLKDFARAVREDAAAGVEGVPQVGGAARLRALPRQGRTSTSASRSTAPRSTASRRIRPRWQRGVQAGRRRDRRGAGPGLRREVFPAREQGADGKAGRQPARRLQAEHRRPRLDGAGDEEGGARQARQDQDQDRLSGEVARLLEARHQARRPRRQRDARATSSNSSAISTSSASRSTATSGS